MTNPAGPDPTAMLRRLRARPVSSWAVAGRAEAMRAALQRLADLAADAGRTRRRAVPDVGAVALPDQFAVLTGEAIAAGVSPAVLHGVLADLADALSLGR